MTEVNNNLPTNTAAHLTANTVAAPPLTESEPESEEEAEQKRNKNPPIINETNEWRFAYCSPRVACVDDMESIDGNNSIVVEAEENKSSSSSNDVAVPMQPSDPIIPLAIDKEEPTTAEEKDQQSLEQEQGQTATTSAATTTITTASSPAAEPGWSKPSNKTDCTTSSNC